MLNPNPITFLRFLLSLCAGCAPLGFVICFISLYKKEVLNAVYQNGSSIFCNLCIMIDNKSCNILNFIHEMLHFSLKAINHRVREKSAHIFSQTELRAAAPTLDCPADAAAAGFSTQCYRRQKVCFSFSSSERKMSHFSSMCSP